LNCPRKKFGPNFKELWNFLPKKLSLSSQKYEFGIRNPRSGIRNKPIPDPGSRRQKGPNPGSRIRIRNTEKIYEIYDEKLSLRIRIQNLCSGSGIWAPNPDFITSLKMLIWMRIRIRNPLPVVYISLLFMHGPSSFSVRRHSYESLAVKLTQYAYARYQLHKRNILCTLQYSSLPCF
jgi:hypothetical protein